jgi:hypothetical protein
MQAHISENLNWRVTAKDTGRFHRAQFQELCSTTVDKFRKALIFHPARDLKR